MSKVKINSARCVADGLDGSDNGFTRKVLLPGEVHGIETIYMEIQKGNSYDYQAEEKIIRVLFFINGEGSFSQEKMSIPVHRHALCIPDMNRGFSMSGGTGNLSYLEIAMSMTDRDMDDLPGQPASFPYYTKYEESRRYTESIKSEETINRMILPEGIVSRLCIGSVQTSGPDRVAAHTHPMLEQFFLALPGNDATVFAETDEVRFLADELLHIPLGSLHGVNVEAGKYLHYLWVDLFAARDEMDYINNNHIFINE